MTRRFLSLCCVGVMAGFLGSAMAQERSSADKAPKTSSNLSGSTEKATAIPDGASAQPARDVALRDERLARVEGEKRFRTNCGRCHMAPHKFPPRVMATAIRHMRVRATITDEDMRLILRYMTQ